jgi:hypothetical protein
MNAKLLEAAKAVVAAGWDDAAPEGEEIDMNALHEKIELLRAAVAAVAAAELEVWECAHVAFSRVSWKCAHCGQWNSPGYMSCGRCEKKVTT